MNKNMPYNVMRHSRWDTAPRDPVTLFAYFSGTVGLSTGAALLATAVSTIAISAVTSWAISALAPKPDFSSFGSQGTLVNSRDATASADFVYGEVRKGGTVTFYEATGDENRYLNQIIVLAAHEVEEIKDIYVNDKIVSLNSEHWVTEKIWSVETVGPVSEVGGVWYDSDSATFYKSYLRIESFDGSQTTPPFYLLVSSELTGSDALTNDFVGNGIAYLYAQYIYDSDVYASGVPLITALVKGKKVYDPRTSTTAYSNNAALCIRDFITSTYGLNDSAIDDVSFSAAANESDEDVALSGSGTEKRYTINGIIKASSPVGDVLGQMSTACAGTLFWGSGYWKLKVGAYSSPVKTLTLDDLRSEINLSTRSTMRDSFNGVTGTFNDASADFITADYPAIKSDPFKTEDGGDELLLDLPLPFTTSAATAQRIAKMTLYRGREQMTISADFGLEAFNLEVGDIIAFTNPRYGFDEKEFEVIGWKFSSNQDAGDLRVSLTLQETSEAAFDWNAEETGIINNNTNLPDFKTVSLPTNLTLTSEAPINGDGSTAGYILVEWGASPDAFVSFYEVQHKISTDSQYSGSTTTLTSHTIAPTISSTIYDVRVRGVSGIGVKSDWVEASVTSSRDEIAPSAPTSVAASAGYRQNIINWVNPSDLDLSFVQVYANTVNNSSTAAAIGTVKGTEFVHGDLPEQTTRYYWAKSVDTSGNISGFSAVTTATTLADPQDGVDGDPGDNGDTIVTGRVYYQILQSSAPSKPSASGYNVGTGTFSGLTSGWALTQPSVDITDTSVQEWSSQYQVTIDGTTGTPTISFTTPSGAIQVTATLESDNFQTGVQGWQIRRDNDTAEFGAAFIRGTLTANQIQIDNVTLDSDGSGNLIIKSGGVDTSQLATSSVVTSTITARAATDATIASSSSITLSSTGSQSLGSFSTTEANQFIILQASANAYGTGSGTAYSVALTVDGSAVALFVNSTNDSYATYNDLRFPVVVLDRRVVASSGSHTLGLSYVIQGGSSIELVSLDVVITLLKR
jgi:hypothetical protein